MFTDMVGYTALGQRNEQLSLALVEEQRKLIRPILARHNGREIKTIGDAFLVEFSSALEAVRCAYEIQRMIREANFSLPEDRQLHIRIGVHLGDVVESGGDISGDAVNVASRIEPLAEDGGVCLTSQVYYNVKNKVDLQLSSMGPRALKNVAEPVEVYRMVMPWDLPEGQSQERADKKRIAVLPFTNLSSDPEEGYFADGMTEELITSLSGVRQLTVIARTSVMGYKGATKKVREIGGELGVGSVLEGSVRKAGNRVRITAQLIDVGTEGHLWAQNYDRQLEDIFAIQSEIAEKVAAELKVRLVEEERRMIELKPTENTEAYTFYLRGKRLVGERTEKAFRQALEVFQKALELDPTFAKAHAGVAECYVSLVMDGYDAYERAAPRAEISAKKALSLNPELAEAHATLANVDFLEDNLIGGEAEARRAIALNPSLPDAHDILSDMALMNGRVEEGVREMEAAYHLDPVVPHIVGRLGRIYFNTGRENDALRHWERTVQLAPAETYRGLTEYYINKGDMDRAKDCYSKAVQADPASRWVKWMKGFMAALQGDTKAAQEAIREIEEEWLGATNLNDVAFVYYALGDLDSYFAYVNRATDQHTLRYSYVLYSPLFAKARNDSRYQDLMHKVEKLASTAPG
jgi:TolB-like protein/Flp pilus assembly protein TadD